VPGRRTPKTAGDLLWHPAGHDGRALHPAFLLAAVAEIGGVFVIGSLAWGMVVDGFRPDRFDVIGALICLAGVAVIMYSPRAA
jgi:drug/metabolite transporter superfamily protein YnfA